MSEEQDNVKKPWCVTEEKPLGDLEVGLAIVATGFRTQEDADNWIKDNIQEGQELTSMRTGNAYKVEVVRKVSQV